jgi:hypothetical protein
MSTFGELVALDLEYFTPKGREVMEKVFWKNSLAAYRWKKAPRQPAQSRPDRPHNKKPKQEKGTRAMMKTHRRRIADRSPVGRARHGANTANFCGGAKAVR